MNISKTQEGSTLNIALEGRLDTTASPLLEEELDANLDGITDLVFDFDALEYVSSAGLRVLLSAQKRMNRQGKMTITNAKPLIMEIFDITGFTDILNIE